MTSSPDQGYHWIRGKIELLERQGLGERRGRESPSVHRAEPRSALPGSSRLQLGLDWTAARRSPEQVGVLDDWTSAGVGQFHSCAIRSGRLLCWGNNNRGRVNGARQLGLRNLRNRYAPAPVCWSATGRTMSP